jgi:large subunit ribosomal protein L2
MPLKTFRPITAALRFTALNRPEEIVGKRPERGLVEHKHKTGGRNCYGRLTSRRRGGGHKQLYRIIDFKRAKIDIPATVQAIEYDPNRSALIALVAYRDGAKNYILAPQGLKVGDRVISAAKCVNNEYRTGDAYPLETIPLATRVHAVELFPGRGAQLARSAGVGLELIAIESGNAQLKLPSGEIRLVNAQCRATIGEVGNADHINESLGKAGRNRWLGRRPRVRGMAMNPVDHPNGGGQGKSKGGGGRQQVVSPWGQLAKGFPTRRRSRPSNSLILIRHNGRPPRGKK